MRDGEIVRDANFVVRLVCTYCTFTAGILLPQKTQYMHVVNAHSISCKPPGENRVRVRHNPCVRVIVKSCIQDDACVHEKK